MFNLDMVGRLKVDPKTGTSNAPHRRPRHRQAVQAADRQAAQGVRLRALAQGERLRAERPRLVLRQEGAGAVRLDRRPRRLPPARPTPPTRSTSRACAAIVDMSEKIVDHPDAHGQAGVRRGQGRQRRAGMTGGPRLGIRPGYGEDDKGVKVEGVGEGGPADRGGIKGGDVVVSIAGKPVKDLQTYMQAMAVQKAGTTIEVVVQRGGKKVTLKVKLD